MDGDGALDCSTLDGADGPPGGATVSVTSETTGTNATVTAGASEPMDVLFLRTGVDQP